MTLTTEQLRQEEQYQFPYHYLVDFNHFSIQRVFGGGLNYFGYLSRIITIISDLNWGKMLDFGCGDGKMIFELSTKMPERTLVGLDFSPRAIAFAKAFSYNRSNVKFELSRLEDFDEKFDLITAVEVLEHIPDNEIEKIVRLIDGHLVSGGYLVVSVPTLNDPLNPKHFRHYNLPMIQTSFPNYKLIRQEFLISNSYFSVFLNRLSNKFGNFKFLRLLILRLAQKFYFKANSQNGTHLVCVFQKGDF